MLYIEYDTHNGTWIVVREQGCVYYGTLDQCKAFLWYEWTHTLDGLSYEAR